MKYITGLLLMLMSTAGWSEDTIYQLFIPIKKMLKSSRTSASP